MKWSILHRGLLTIGLIAFSLSQLVPAQGFLDAGKNLLGGSGGSGGAAGIAGALPLDKIMSLLRSQGYSNITGLGPSPSGDTLQASATNPSGTPVNLLINPTTGGIISALAK